MAYDEIIDEASFAALLKEFDGSSPFLETKAIFFRAERMAEQQAIAFGQFISNHRLDFQPAKDGNWIGLDMKTYSNEKLYQLFLTR